MSEDVKIAELELEGLGFVNCYRVKSLNDLHDALNNLHVPIGRDPSTLSVLLETSKDSIDGFVAMAAPENLTCLLKRTAFVREVYLIGKQSDMVRYLSDLPTQYHDRAVTIVETANDIVIVRAIPVSVFLELSEALAITCNLDEMERLSDELFRYIEHGFTETEVRNKALRTRLRKVRFNDYASHSFHIYKARFFPRLVRAVINYCLGCKTGHVLDPFVGSGTTLIESSLMGLESMGIDLDPLSVLMSQIKTKALSWNCDVIFKIKKAYETSLRLLRGHNPNVAESLSQLTESDEITGRSYEKSRDFIPSYLKKRLDAATVKEVENHVWLISTAIDRICIDFEEGRLYFKLMLSDALLKKFRLRFHGLGFGRFAIESRRESLKDLFLQQAERSLKILLAYRVVAKRIGLTDIMAASSSNVICADFLKTTVSNELDCIITSPPYLPAASGRESYLRSKGLSLLALGLISSEDDIWDLETAFLGSIGLSTDVTNFDKSELERSRLPNIAKDLVLFLLYDKYRKAKAYPTFRYFIGLREAMRRFGEIVKPHGKVAIIVSTHSTFYRYTSRETVRKENVGDIVEELAMSVPTLRLIKRIDLPLIKNLRVARPRAQDSYYESVLVFERINGTTS